MKKTLFLRLLIIVLAFSSITGFSTVKANALVTKENLEIIEINADEITPRTAYDWWAYNIGVSGWGQTQIIGPMSGGDFTTDGVLGSNYIYKISWSETTSGSKFRIKAVGQDSGNSGKTSYSDFCYNSSGTITFTIPAETRGRIKLYVDSFTATAINVGTLNLDSR